MVFELEDFIRGLPKSTMKGTHFANDEASFQQALRDGDITATVDDGATFYCDRANRIVGHAPLGFEARQAGNPVRYGAKWNLLLGVDTTGVVASWLYQDGGTTTEMWHLFLMFFVLPAIAGGRARCLVQDNEQSHMHQMHRTLVRNAGHALVHTPIHSPDFNTVEWCFEEIALHMQRNTNFITPGNLNQWLRTALGTLSGPKNARYAVRAHYFVPGAAEYRPYVG